MLVISKKLVGLITLFCICSFAQAEIDAGDKQPMPELRWLDVAGEQHRLSEMTDKPKLLHFWAAWCIPCRKELPEVAQWQKENPQIDVLALSLDQKIAQTKYFVKKYNIDMPALLLNEDDSDALGVPVVPYTIFVSKDNRFLGSLPGVAPWLEPAFTEEVRSLLLPLQADVLK